MGALYQRQIRELRAADGTVLAYHWHARGSSRGKRPVLLTNGIGTTENFWRHLVEALAQEYQVVHWDYRGHGQSANAANDVYDLETLAEDLGQVTDAVMRESGGLAPVHVAFSMGVAVLLEMYRRRPNYVAAAVLIAGAADPPWAQRLPLKVPSVLKAVRTLIGAATPLAPFLSSPVRRALKSPWVYGVGRMAGVLRARASREDVDAMMRGLAAMDFRAYLKTLVALMSANATDVVPTFDVPTLVIGAANDVFIPVEQVRAMSQKMPQARYLEVDDAGHAGLIEAGDEVASHVQQFVEAFASAETSSLKR
jgi:pimeloyl-ACP methyl ester carboxylesterase